MSNNREVEVGSEASQPLLIRYEDNFQSLKSRTERMTHILEQMVDNLNGAQPPDLQPITTTVQPEPARDDLPMLGRMDRAADDAFTAINQLEHQLERLQSLQLL